MSASEDRIRALPLWRGPIEIAPLKGGLSNESWLVSDQVGRHVVRFGKDYPFHHVLREREAIVFEWFSGRQIPIAFVLAGGYSGGKLSRDELVLLHRRTIEASCAVSALVD